jgi:DNA repair protein SbcC/Rad50
MNLKSLQLNNIRSYKDEKINFMNGITLFEGDIGSGKSSILNAVEFALFGLGDQSGSHLLRVGENEGKVELAILVNGKEYIFSRGLTRKRGKISQDSCYIIENNALTKFNATDMKRRALQILDFKEPMSPRSQSVIYRYAVFTPQEQMREVIRQKPENRKETLRKALGVEEYSIAAGNADSVFSALRGEVRQLEKSRVEAELTQARITEEENNIKEKNIDIKSTEVSLEKLGAKNIRVREELVQKKKAETDLNGLIQRHKLLEQEKKRLEQDITTNTKALNDINQKIFSAKQSKIRCEELFPLYEEYKQIRVELPRLQKKYDLDRTLKQQIEIIQVEINSKREALETHLQTLEDEIFDLNDEIDSLQKELTKLPELTTKISELELQITKIDIIREENIQNQNNRKVIQQEIKQLETQKKEKNEEWKTISSLGVGATCPRCQQKLSENHYKLLELKIQSEIERIDKNITEKQTTLRGIDQKIIEEKTILTELERKEKSLNRLKIEQAQLTKDHEMREKYLADKASSEGRKAELELLIENDFFAHKQKQEIALIDAEKNKLSIYVQKYQELRKKNEHLEEIQIEEKYTQSKTITERIPELISSLTTLEAEKGRLIDSLQEKAENLSNIATEIKTYDDLEIQISALQEEEKVLIQEEATQTAHITAYKSEVQVSIKWIEQLEVELTRHRDNVLQAETLQIVEAWLREILIPSFQNIEKNILLSLNQEFNKMFRRWFGELIESEELQGLIDEDFTPLVEQSGYELDVESLSGGEKTSVALAYRLALNTIVKQVTNTMKSNLLILDEPTDGFSKEQLFKMRDILKKLDCDQVILVSHEKELETVADYIYRVRKEGNTSTIISPVEQSNI